MQYRTVRTVGLGVRVLSTVREVLWTALRPSAATSNKEILRTLEHGLYSTRKVPGKEIGIQSLGDTLARSSLVALEVKRRPWPSHSITCEGPPSLLVAFMVSLFY